MLADIFLPLTKAFMAGKGIVIAWLAAGLSTFGILERAEQGTTYAIIVASISALGAALITGIVRVIVTLINTSRSRRQQRQRELDGEINRWHQFYAEKIAFIEDQLFTEVNILRIVRNGKHQLIADIGARDSYISNLEDTLRGASVHFDRKAFRNLAEAFREEDEQVGQIIQKAIHSKVPTPALTKV